MRPVLLSWVSISPSVCISVTVASAEAGQCVSLALKRVKRAEVRKGMVLVPKTDTVRTHFYLIQLLSSEYRSTAISRFEGQVLIL